MTGSSPGTDPTARLRTHLRLLGWIVLGGIGIELASTRHWGSWKQSIAWIALGLAAVGLVAVALRSHPNVAHAGRLVLAAVCLVAVFGVWAHVQGNHEVGPLDRRYATSWSTLPAAQQWWLAASGGVGPSPPLVPLTLALAATLGILGGAPGSAQAQLPAEVRGHDRCDVEA